MIIDASCGEIINSKKVYVHDDVVDEIYFNRTEKKLNLTIMKQENNKRLTIDFLHVIGFEMSSCDFWGSSPNIYDFEYVSHYDNTIIPKLFEKKDTNNFPFCKLNDREKYFETIITFTSGDQLKIACEKVVIEG